MGQLLQRSIGEEKAEEVEDRKEWKRMSMKRKKEEKVTTYTGKHNGKIKSENKVGN